MPFPSSTKYAPKEIVADIDTCGKPQPIYVLNGLNLVAGTVMGKVTASGLWKAYSSGASDGSQIPWGILAHNVDSTNNGGNKVAAGLYVKGTFITANLTGLDSNALTVRATWLSNTALGLTIL